MARYIDADKVLQELGDAPLNWTDSEAEMQEQSDYKLFKSIIESQPTADVVEVKHGKWIECFEDWRKQISGDECSVCGFRHYGTSISDYHYCPNCGAKMDEEGDSND